MPLDLAKYLASQTNPNAAPDDTAAPVTAPVVAPATTTPQPTATTAPLQTTQPTAVPTAPTTAQPSTPQTFKQKLLAAANQLGVKPGPGNWARTLVASAVSALGDAETNFGDAAAGGNAKSGDVIGSVANVLAARNQRLAQQQQQQIENQRKNKELAGLTAEQQARIQQAQATTAHENVLALHESRAWSQLDAEAKKKAITQDQADLAADQSGELPAPVLARDVDSDEIGRLIKNGTVDPSKSHRYLTGQKEVGENPDGSPIYRDSYTLTGQADGPQKITSEFAKRYNAAFPDRPPLPTDGSGTTDWTTLKYNQQLTSMAETAKLIRESNERKLGLEAEKQSTDEESNNLQKDPRFVKFMSQANLNGVAAFQLASADPKMASDYPRLMHDFVSAVGTNVWDKQIEQATDNHNTAQAELTKIKNDPAEISGDRAIATMATASARMRDPLTPAAEKQQWKDIYAQASTANNLYEQRKKNEANADGSLTKPQEAAMKNIESFATKDRTGYSAKAAENALFGDNLTQAANGDEVAAMISRTLGIQGINKVADLSRISPTEYEAMANVGSAGRRIYQAILKNGSGTLAPATVAELKNLQQSIQKTEYNGYLGSVSLVARQNKLDPDKVIVLAPDGSTNLTLKDAQSQFGQPTQTPSPNQPQPTGHKVGDVIMQNGRNFTVTSVDASGKVTGAN